MARTFVASVHASIYLFPRDQQFRMSLMLLVDEMQPHLPRPKAQAARLQYKTAFWLSYWIASVYFLYAPVKSFLRKSALPSALRSSDWLRGVGSDMVVKS